jgi:putative FmdB family regulatory protein
MALYEYFCDACRHRFEQIVSGGSDPEAGRCPKCARREDSRRLISRFAIGGQGDLRESTFHGCHGHFTGLGRDDGRGASGGHGHDHDHGHDHSQSDCESGAG